MRSLRSLICLVLVAWCSHVAPGEPRDVPRWQPERSSVAAAPRGESERAAVRVQTETIGVARSSSEKTRAVAGPPPEGDEGLTLHRQRESGAFVEWIAETVAQEHLRVNGSADAGGKRA